MQRRGLRKGEACGSPMSATAIPPRQTRSAPIDARLPYSPSTGTSLGARDVFRGGHDTRIFVRAPSERKTPHHAILHAAMPA